MRRCLMFGTRAEWMRLESEICPLLADPYETENRANERPDFVCDLQEAGQDWWSGRDRECPLRQGVSIGFCLMY